MAANITPMENMINVIVALVYLGAGESVPSNHVANIPPELVMINAMATAVARRTWGAALFAFQVESVGAKP